MAASRVWFITGASSGFGRSLLELVLKKGDNAVATLRTPEVLDPLKAQYPADKLLALQLDVTNTAEIASAFRQSKSHFGRIDVVFNNAGSGVLAEVEGTPDDAARYMFDANFWGAANVSREAVRFFREELPSGQGGRLFVTSSMSAMHPAPAVGYYGASKAAISSLTQALESELDPEWNIKITILEMGSFETEGRAKSVTIPPHSAYTKPSLITAQIREAMKNPTGRRGNPEKASERLWDLAREEAPPLRLVLGQDAISRTRQQLERIEKDVARYESWSVGLGFDS